MFFAILLQSKEGTGQPTTIPTEHINKGKYIHPKYTYLKQYNLFKNGPPPYLPKANRDDKLRVTFTYRSTAHFRAPKLSTFHFQLSI